MLRCGPRIFFPDFFVRGSKRSILIEICGFSSEQNWKRLVEKLGIYRAHKVADVLMVIYLRQDEDRANFISQRFHNAIHLIPIGEFDEIGTILQLSHAPLRNFRSVTEYEALRRCSLIDGKQIHWQRLLSAMPRERWIETLANLGLPEFDLRRIRKMQGLNKRLIEGTRLACKLGMVPREALVEMIAGTYNGAAGSHFGSMNALVLLAETSSLEKFS
jgi:hypothetical protein